MNAARILWICALLAALMCGATYGQETRTLAEQPDLKKQIQAAKVLRTEALPEPIKSVRRDPPLWVPNPDGKTYDILMWHYPRYNKSTSLTIIDLGTGEVKQHDLGDDRCPNHCGRVVAADGKMYLDLCAYKTGVELYVYDPATNEFTSRGVAAERLMTGSAWDCGMVIGTDGKIYSVGNYPKEQQPGFYQLDPETGKIFASGPIGPKCQAIRTGSIASDGRYVYLNTHKQPYQIIVYDMQTKKAEVLLEAEMVGGWAKVAQRRGGCVGGVKKLKGQKEGPEHRDFWLHEGKAIPIKTRNEAPPWPTKDLKPWAKMPPKPEIFLDRADPTSEGDAEVWVRNPPAVAESHFEDPADPKLAAAGWKVTRYKTAVFGQQITRMIELPDGRIFGAAGQYQGNFIYDPKTEQSVHLGTTMLSQYVLTHQDGKVYLGGYPSGGLWVYDLSRPWTVRKDTPGEKPIPIRDKRSNPRHLANLQQVCGALKMYGAAVGADAKVYLGGRWYRDGGGGGFGWWDPATDKAHGLWKVFSNYQITHICSADAGKYIAISARRKHDIVLKKPTPNEGALFIFDTGQGKIVRKVEPVLGVLGPGPVVSVGHRVIGWTCRMGDKETSIIWLLDVRTGEVEFTRTIPYRFPIKLGSNQMEGFDFRLGPDGMIWTYMGFAPSRPVGADGYLVRIDPKDASVKVVGKIRSHTGVLAFAGNDVYLGSWAKLRRIKGVLSDMKPAASAFAW